VYSNFIFVATRAELPLFRKNKVCIQYRSFKDFGEG